MDKETKKLLGIGLVAFAVLKMTQKPKIVYIPQPTGNLGNNYAAWLEYTKAVANSAISLYGSIQNAVNVLWGPGGPFEKTPVPLYDAGSLFWQDVGGGKMAGIGTIYAQIPALYECNDGTFSTSDSARGCVRHGGKRSGTPVQLSDGYSGLLNIRDIPIGQIQIDTKLFQGRDKEYSERSVQNIVQDVANSRFLWENLDPIILWASMDGRLFLLSGHSRLEAFRRLSNAGAVAQGKRFDRIPSKILQNVPVDVAKTVALESNTLSTKETDIERAAYYRRLRQDGTPERAILENLKKNEGKNWTNVYAYTFLNPSGTTWGTLKQFAESEDNSATLAKILARWIGQARRQFPILTNEHENEIGRWLIEQKGYGTGRNQVSNEREFLEKVNEFIQKNTFFGEFDTTKPLNILNLLSKSPVEQEYELQIEAARREVEDAESDLKSKIRKLAQTTATKADVQRITQPLETRLRNARIELQKMIQRKSQIIEYSKNEPALFGFRMSPAWAFLLPGV